jgi:mRNA interferase HigB
MQPKRRKRMHIISKKKLRDFWSRYPRARSPLEAWYQIAKKAKWQNFADVRAAFGSADRVGRFVVFNIGGNKYRLIAAIHFHRGKVVIREGLTHAEYDQAQWRED